MPPSLEIGQPSNSIGSLSGSSCPFLDYIILAVTNGLEYSVSGPKSGLEKQSSHHHIQHQGMRRKSDRLLELLSKPLPNKPSWMSVLYRESLNF